MNRPGRCTPVPRPRHRVCITKMVDRYRVMTPDELARLREEKYNATVVRLDRLHSDLVVMRVRPDKPRPAHKAGQYTVLGLGYWEPRHPGCQAEELDSLLLPRLARRSYSISCSVLDDEG